ncbi:hypothetical protein FGF80_11530 [Natrinema pallidum]|uniref:Uncharacterized protein n=1 Tax=Natrinema pallidum TaxID=69527 RepID=A0A4P9TGI2_9EURY|nr:hypothetical protein FGF80_11530 [Natrinema pallidum]
MPTTYSSGSNWSQTTSFGRPISACCWGPNRVVTERQCTPDRRTVLRSVCESFQLLSTVRRQIHNR